jgi:hypothetical protein
MPAFDRVGIKNWDEILDHSTEPAVFKAHVNWQARLAAMSIYICLQHRAMLSQNHRFWGYAGSSTRQQDYLRASNVL